MAKFIQSVTITCTHELNLEFEAPTQEMADGMMDDLSSSYDELLYETLADRGQFPSWSLELEGSVVRVKPGDKPRITVEDSDLDDFCQSWIEDNTDEEAG